MEQNSILDIDSPADSAADPPADPPAGQADAIGAGVRPLRPALMRGWRRRCPNCGGGPMMNGYLKVRHSCASCGEELYHHRADDLPAWATILIVGHVLAFGLVTVESNFAPPLWVHWSIWPVVTLGLSMWLLPRIKGMVVAFQWSRRMHGFDDYRPPTGS